MSQTRVTIVSGAVSGVEREEVFLFRGIPYGATTGGANRFLPPRAPEPWEGVRECLSYGLPSQQPFGGSPCRPHKQPNR